VDRFQVADAIKKNTDHDEAKTEPSNIFIVIIKSIKFISLIQICSSLLWVVIKCTIKLNSKKIYNSWQYEAEVRNDFYQYPECTVLVYILVKTIRIDIGQVMLLIHDYSSINYNLGCSKKLT
jgi:hypothetical protein